MREEKREIAGGETREHKGTGVASEDEFGM
jgi:hypothetical protein